MQCALKQHQRFLYIKKTEKKQELLPRKVLLSQQTQSLVTVGTGRLCLITRLLPPGRASIPYNTSGSPLLTRFWVMYLYIKHFQKDSFCFQISCKKKDKANIVFESQMIPERGIVWWKVLYSVIHISTQCSKLALGNVGVSLP